MFINHECKCGPFMDSSKLFELPKQLGPGLVQKVLKDTIQHLVNTAHDIQSVTTLMKKQGDSTCTITGKYIYKLHYINNKIHLYKSSFCVFIFFMRSCMVYHVIIFCSTVKI